MQKALTAPALIERGKQRAAAFTWQQTAQSVLRAIAAPLSSRAFFPRFLPALSSRAFFPRMTGWPR
jgi:hypothetical protein